jgi:hypothetical protein
MVLQGFQIKLAAGGTPPGSIGGGAAYLEHHFVFFDSM